MVDGPAGTMLLTDDGAGLALRLARRLRERGWAADVVRADALADAVAAAAGRRVVVLCHPAGELPLTAGAETFLALRAAVPALAGGELVALLRGDLDPRGAGLAGMVRTVGWEYPGIACRTVALAGDAGLDATVEALAARGPAELFVQGDALRRGVLRPWAPNPGAPPLAPGDLLLVTGGARGVTAEAAAALAAAWRPTCLLWGRSPAPLPEEPWLSECPDAPALQRAFLARFAGEGPRRIKERVAAALANRDALATVAKLEAAGCAVHVRSVDVADPAAVRNAASAARREFGPIRGVVHGAGVLADRLIADKDAESFTRVVATKLGGLAALLAELPADGPDALKALALFASSTGRFGRKGQVDYAFANAALDAVAEREAARRPGCRVLACDWGPWDGGMVTPALRDVFAAEGVALIPRDAGAAFLAAALADPHAPTNVVVLGRGSRLPEAVPLPPLAAPEPPPRGDGLSLVVSAAAFPVLRSHALDGKLVAPLALMAEWLADAAVKRYPTLRFHGFDRLRVHRGVRIGTRDAAALRVALGEPLRAGDTLIVSARLLADDEQAAPLAAAEVVLVRSLPPAPAAAAPLQLPRLAKPLDEVYAEWLFHGPDLRAILDVHGCGTEGIDAAVRCRVPPAAWSPAPEYREWHADPLALDAAFQLLIVWSQHQMGMPSLPSAVASYRQWRRFPEKEVRVVAAARAASALHREAGTNGAAALRAEIDFLGPAGELVARIAGFEGTADERLRRAFARRLPEPRA